jgi:hypothetical protein
MLRTYIEDVRQLHRDVRALIADLDFAEHGGTVKYLLDSSEVSAYVLPAEAQPVALVADESPVARAISYELTTRILFGGREMTGLLGSALLLAPPYIAEIESLAHAVSERSLKKMKELRDTRDEIHREAEEFVGSAEYRQFETLLTREKVDSEAIEMITTFLSERASRLLELARFDDPTARLADVLTSDRVAQFRVHYPDVDMHAHTADRWFNALSDTREGDSTRDFAERDPRDRGRDRKERDRIMPRRLDSVAMGFLFAGNSRDPKRLRFRLITRSNAMQDVMMRSNGDLVYWKDVGGSPLRHPRSIMAWIIATAVGGTAGALGRLRRLAASLEVFLLSSAENPGDDTRGADIEARFSKIRQEWRSSAELAFSMTEADISKRTASDTMDKLRKIFDLSANRPALGDHITYWISRIASGVSRNFQLLGFIMQGTQETKKEAGDALTLHDGAHGAVVLSSSLNWMPYSIEFYAPKMREYKQGHPSTESWSAFSRFLEEWMLDPDARQDEALLAIAYLTASIQHWQAAEKYAELAFGGLRAGDRAHEFLFLRALCKRKHDPTPKRLRYALDLIEQAIEDKSKSVEGGYRDPRFLKEQSVLIFLLLRGDGVDDGIERLPAQQAIDLSNEVLNHPDADEYLKVQVYNNLCYHELYQTDHLDVPRLRELLDQLTEEQRKLERDRRKWAPNIRDTVAWAQWRVGTYGDNELSVSELDQLTQEYREILETVAFDSPDRTEFARRLSIIEGALNRRMAADAPSS